MSIFEHSKKLGRILALTITLVIAGTLSVMLALSKPDQIPDMVDKWLILLGSMASFYFAITKTPTDPTP